MPATYNYCSSRKFVLFLQRHIPNVDSWFEQSVSLHFEVDNFLDDVIRHDMESDHIF